ncbi:MAG: exodeoxyribonuclease V subunit alpha [Tahibacter sp.]
MSLHGFRRDAGELVVEAWRPLDRALYRWVREHGGSGLLAATAAWTSLADGDGDAALHLDASQHRNGMPALSAEDIASLRGEAMVGTGPETPKPFVLDESRRFYIYRNVQDEATAAELLRSRRVPQMTPVVDDVVIDELFHGLRGAELEAQREAVRRVVGRRLFVLTGGPGTGKTTTVLRMLLMLQHQARRTQSIRVAAPTGKAAQRLLQALRQGKSALREHATLPLSPVWQTYLEAVPDRDALTLHRLLDYQPWRNAFGRGARQPIDADIVVVDEASMIDLAMLRRLLAAVKPESTLILVGDADQLASVATGSVLMDLVAVLEAQGRADLTRLHHSFRAARHLVSINEAVRVGDSGALRAALTAAGAHAQQRRIDDGAALNANLRRWATQLSAVPGLRPLLDSRDSPHLEQNDNAVTLDADAAALPLSNSRPTDMRRQTVLAALDALGQRQLLCAMREGNFGALAINIVLERLLRNAWHLDEGQEWYAGRAIIITRNDYGAGLFNGDIGLCLVDADGRLRVWFETAQISAAGDAVGNREPGPAGLQRHVRSYAPNTLPSHETAFAITIHKSQGSEYQHAAVLLPPDADHRILSRQLLYTGVSRAKQSVEIWSSDAALDSALRQPVTRSGGLAERLLAP